MDAFTAANGFTVQNSALQNYIQSRRDDFNYNVSDATMQHIQSQTDLLNLQSPVMSYQQIERIKLQKRNVIDPHAVERMDTPYLLKTASEFNQPLVMANPHLHQMHKLGQIEGYGLDADDTLAKLLQERVMSGMVIEQNGKMVHREYVDSAGDLAIYNYLSGLERLAIQANQRDAITSVLDDIDFSSLYNGGF